MRNSGLRARTSELLGGGGFAADDADNDPGAPIYRLGNISIWAFFKLGPPVQIFHELTAGGQHNRGKSGFCFVSLATLNLGHPQLIHENSWGVFGDKLVKAASLFKKRGSPSPWNLVELRVNPDVAIAGIAENSKTIAISRMLSGYEYDY